MLLEPVHGCILRPLQPMLLLRIVHIAPRGKPMIQTREILIVILDIESRDHLVGVFFQLGREHLVIFWSADLHRHRDLVDFVLFETRWVGGGDAVDQVFTYARSA